MKVSGDMIKRLRSSLPAGAPRERAVLDLCDAVIAARESLALLVVRAQEIADEYPQEIEEGDEWEHMAAALRSVLEMLEAPKGGMA